MINFLALPGAEELAEQTPCQTFLSIDRRREYQTLRFRQVLPRRVALSGEIKAPHRIFFEARPDGARDFCPGGATAVRVF